jgi:transglutaminase-like putative cysteine protease
MNRRDVLRSVGIASKSLAIPGTTRFFAGSTTPGSWRTFEVTTRVEVLNSSGATRVWLPAALIGETPFQRTFTNRFHADGGSAQMVESKADALGIVAAEFPAGVKPVLTLTSRIATRNYSVALDTPAKAPRVDPTELRYCLRPTTLLPTNGIVKTTADEITSGAHRDIEKAHAIYDWIVDNTFPDPKTRGCGVGDIRFMLESKDLGGKCGDLNALFVGLARAAGLPARDVYGICVGKSELGYKSLGTSSENVTRAQHCRAEVHLTAHGWVAVDPADVRKVALEEPPGIRAMSDDLVKKARARFFGSWEMNWIAHNIAQDVALPGSSGPPIGFLMYPQGETADGPLDCLDPDNFKYEITSEEV